MGSRRNLPGPDLEMQVGTSGPPALADERDAIAGADRLPLRDQQQRACAYTVSRSPRVLAATIMLP